MPKISIAMATYNGEKYICEQLDSITTQTFSDWELIICDDCSKDSTWNILERYASQDSRIHVYRNEQNLGFKKNFEKAISFCNGDYIALSDQDDVWEKNHLVALYENLGTASLSCANARLIDAYGNQLNELLNQNEGLMFFENQSSKFLYRILLKGNCLQGASMLMPSNFAMGCLPIPRKVLYHDAWFAACACMENGINYSFDVVNNYRQHGNNVTYTLHNKDTRAFFHKIKSKLSIFFGSTLTDRFDYIRELEKRYGLQNEDFVKIKSIVDDIEKKRFSIKDVIFIWKNYFYITTQNNHKKFIKTVMILKRWQSHTVDNK